MSVPDFEPRKGERSQAVFNGRPEELILVGSGLATALTSIYLLVIKYNLFQKLQSKHNQRLLNSVQVWLDHGFWRLGGFLYFNDTYDGSFPHQLYRSHSPYYVWPHYLVTLLAGRPAFWLVTGWLPILMAILLSLALSCIACLAVNSLSKWQPWAAMRGAPLVAAVAAFSICFSSEPIWSLAWNNFDGSWSLLFQVSAVAIALLAGKLSQGWFHWISVLLLVISALVCPRLGFFVALALLLIKLSGRRMNRPLVAVAQQRLFTWPVIALVLLASSTHFFRLALAMSLQGLQFKGSDVIPRMGLTGWWENAAQGWLHYLSPLDAFTFIWRQSEIVIYKLPLWISIHHCLIWSLALIAFVSILAERRYFFARPNLELLFLPALLWTVVLNQSAAEHPDLVSMLWLPTYVLGLAFIITRFFVFLRWRCRQEQAYLYTSLLLWLFFLWQNQYLMRAYPQF